MHMDRGDAAGGDCCHRGTTSVAWAIMSSLRSGRCWQPRASWLRVVVVALFVLLIVGGIPVMVGMYTMACPDCVVPGCFGAAGIAAGLLFAAGMDRGGERLRSRRARLRRWLWASILDPPPQLV